MAKQGFAASDRRKVENITLTGATTSIKVHDCGTVFTLNPSDGNAMTLSLPSVRSVGEGWWCRFVIQTATGANSFIDIDATDGVDAGLNKTWTLLAVGADGNGSATWTVDSTGGGNSNDRIKLTTAGDVVGDYVEVMVLNGAWVAHAWSAV